VRGYRVREPSRESKRFIALLLHPVNHSAEN
jgi:hypothetical protein